MSKKLNRLLKDNQEQLIELVNRGDKAAQGEWILNVILEIVTDEKDIVDQVYHPDDGLFIISAAHMRPFFKELLEVLNDEH